MHLTQFVMRPLCAGGSFQRLGEHSASLATLAGSMMSQDVVVRVWHTYTHTHTYTYTQIHTHTHTHYKDKHESQDERIEAYTHTHAPVVDPLCVCVYVCVYARVCA